MDSKRPDVQLDDSPEEEGIVTNRTGERNESSLVGSLLETVRSKLRR